DSRLLQENDTESIEKYESHYMQSDNQLKDEMIETLSLKIAHCTKESEYLKRNKSLYDQTITTLQQENEKLKMNFKNEIAVFTYENTQLKNQFQNLQLLLNTTQEEYQQVKVEFQELKFYAEKQKILFEQREAAVLETNQLLQTQITTSCNKLENEKNNVLENLQHLQLQFAHLQEKYFDYDNLHEMLTLAKASNHKLQQDLLSAKGEEERIEKSLVQANEKKHALESKVQTLMKMLREENTKVNDLLTNVKKQDEQLYNRDAKIKSLEKELSEWKLKYKQSNSHLNKLTIKYAHEERSKANTTNELMETKEKLEKAENRVGELGFQLKQAHEECKYLENLKTQNKPLVIDTVVNDPECDAPSWIKN
ncbi:hypothetical protein THRCLA_20315, partial [Thraustotheca clavata]